MNKAAAKKMPTLIFVKASAAAIPPRTNSAVFWRNTSNLVTNHREAATRITITICGCPGPLAKTYSWQMARIQTIAVRPAAQTVVRTNRQAARARIVAVVHQQMSVSIRNASLPSGALNTPKRSHWPAM